jgi:hypothetical protein
MLIDGGDAAGDARGDAAGGIRWVGYAEGAALLGVQPESFRRLVQRKRWRRQLANDGTVRVAVPLDALPRHGASRPRDVASASPPPASPRDDTPGGVGDTIAALVAAKREAEARAEAVEVRAHELDARLGAMEGDLDRLRTAAEEARAQADQLRRQGDELRDELRRQGETLGARAGRAEGEAAGLREAVRIAEAARQEAQARAAAAEADRARLRALPWWRRLLLPS